MQFSLLITRNSVYRSNVIKGNLSPKWEETRLHLEAVCNGDMNRAMKVVVKDHHARYGKHYEMGEFETTMQGFVNAKQRGGDIDEESAFELRRGGKIVGHVLVLKSSIEIETSGESTDHLTTESGREPRPEFVDYLTGGCEISLAVGIDFTASNGTFQPPMYLVVAPKVI